MVNICAASMFRVSTRAREGATQAGIRVKPAKMSARNSFGSCRGWSLAYSRHVQRGRPRGDDRCLRTDRNSDLCPLRTMIYHYGGDQTALVRNLENLLPICSLRFG